MPLVTPGAQRFVTEETFLALARRPPSEDVYPHLTHADLLVVAPCTANTLAKLAHGIADNVLTEAALAHRGPVLVAPAMNPRMWARAATRANVETLLQRAASSSSAPTRARWPRASGASAGSPSPSEIAARVEQLLAPGSLAGRRVLVTAGGTREPIDSVRFVGNRSSGRMGVALAEEARRRGAEVILLAANLAVAPPHGVEVIPTPTAESMLDAALALPDVDVLLLAAAVADYRPAEALAGKRREGRAALDGRARRRPTDIARALGERKRAGPGARRVRRRARRGGARAQARDAGDEERRPRRLQRRRAQPTSASTPPRTRSCSSRRDGERPVPKARKEAVAAAILDEVEGLLSS